jgi:uncharacterized protein YxeA
MRKNLTIVGIILALIAIIALAIAKTMVMGKTEGFAQEEDQDLEFNKIKAAEIADLVNRG